MKKNIYIFITALIMLSFISFIVMQKNNIKINDLDVTEEKTVAINTTAEDKISNRIFTDFIYDVGPRFGSIKKADLDAMSSFNDIIGEEHAERINGLNRASSAKADVAEPQRIVGRDREVTEPGVAIFEVGLADRFPIDVRSLRREVFHGGRHVVRFVVDCQIGPQLSTGGQLFIELSADPPGLKPQGVSTEVLDRRSIRTGSAISSRWSRPSISTRPKTFCQSGSGQSTSSGWWKCSATFRVSS